MLSRVALELLAAALIAGAVCLAGAAAGLWWLKRRVRRGLEAASRAIATRASTARASTARAAGGWATGGGAASAGRRWLWSRQLPDRRWIEARQARQELWRAVSAANHAVKTARQSGAPTGDLDALCRRLHHSAADADRSLSVASRAPAARGDLGPVPAQVGELIKTAALIHDAAASAAASVMQPAARSLADDARQEAVALSAGIASARRAASGGRPGEPA
jgi:hypothetical protein